MRNIPSHPNGPSALRITANVPAYRGQASHQYVIEGFDTTANPALRSEGIIPRFRNATVVLATEEGGQDMHPDGIPMEALLAILSDHLQGLQSGPTASQGKQIALEYIENAIEVLAQDQGSLQQDMHRFGSHNHGQQYRMSGTL